MISSRRWNVVTVATVIAAAVLGVLLFGAYGPVAASLDSQIIQQGYAPPRQHGFVGTIESATSTSIVLTTKKGDVTINLDGGTKYRAPGVKGATLANFSVGDRVSVLAREVSGANVARHMNLIPGKPPYVHRVGTIDDYQAGTSITLKDKKGETSTFLVTSGTKIQFKKGATEVVVGQRATVVARRDPATDQFTAQAVLVFGPPNP